MIAFGAIMLPYFAIVALPRRTINRLQQNKNIRGV
jgi:hypothetical protein